MRFIVTINGLQHARTDSLGQARRLARAARRDGAVLILDLTAGVVR